MKKKLKPFKVAAEQKNNEENQQRENQQPEQEKLNQSPELNALSPLSMKRLSSIQMNSIKEMNTPISNKGFENFEEKQFDLTPTDQGKNKQDTRVKSQNGENPTNQIHVSEHDEEQTNMRGFTKNIENLDQIPMVESLAQTANDKYESQKLKCPQCKQVGNTKLLFKISKQTLLGSFILGVCTLGICCCVPCFMEDCKDIDHHCPHCGAKIGERKFVLC